ncbi:MAG: hypothetical protein AAGJ35_11550, partial [Myxococcota bacterium]
MRIFYSFIFFSLCFTLHMQWSCVNAPLQERSGESIPESDAENTDGPRTDAGTQRDRGSEQIDASDSESDRGSEQTDASDSEEKTSPESDEQIIPESGILPEDGEFPESTENTLPEETET